MKKIGLVMLILVLAAALAAPGWRPAPVRGSPG